jgi:hypothetical protein
MAPQMLSPWPMLTQAPARMVRSYTKLAREEMKKLSGLPIQLRVLERYGIENYFSQQLFEKIIGTDLTPFFPILDHISALEQLSKSRNSLKYKLRRLIAKTFGFSQPSPTEPLYTKGRNSEVAAELELQDLRGSDLFKIVEEISHTAQRLNDE